MTPPVEPSPTSAADGGSGPASNPVSDLACGPTSGPETGPVNRWLAHTGGTAGPAYAKRFSRLAEQGVDLHGEARLDDLLRREVEGPARVLDAGCGTGRVALELARRGHRVVGLDLDASMLDQAPKASAETGLDVRWFLGDLLDLGRLVEREAFDLGRQVCSEDYLRWCEATGLHHVRTLPTWDATEDDSVTDGDYAVHVHRRPRARL